MKRTALIFTAALVASCGKGEPQSWGFVQSVGGVKVEAPLKSEIGGWALPVLADVSGLKTFTTKPTALNSALACDTDGRVKGKAIFITVFTDRPGSTKTSTCPFVQLGRLEPGTYSVSYWGPDEAPVLIGQVQVGL